MGWSLKSGVSQLGHKEAPFEAKPFEAKAKANASIGTGKRVGKAKARLSPGTGAKDQRDSKEAARVAASAADTTEAAVRGEDGQSSTDDNERVSQMLHLASAF